MNQSQKVLREISDDPEKSILADKYHEMRLGRCYTR